LAPPWPKRGLSNAASVATVVATERITTSNNGVNAAETRNATLLAKELK
jgi:hypothetical protein